MHFLIFASNILQHGDIRHSWTTMELDGSSGLDSHQIMCYIH